MEWMGSFGVALLVALENLFPPIPSEIILPLAGFTASLGSFHLWEAIMWATVGSVTGAIALYYVGFALGRERTRKIMGSLPFVNPRDVERTEAWFDKHGTWTVLFGRVVPIFRSLISIPAGVTGMALPKFVGLTLVGSLVWNTLLVGAGYILGENWHAVEPALDWFKYVVVAVVVAGVFWYVVSRLRSRRNAAAEGDGLGVAEGDGQGASVGERDGAGPETKNAGSALGRDGETGSFESRPAGGSGSRPTGETDRPQG
ncbi:MAG TPA: DedA family protein [Actinomycetales bacterium]|nr:DedA family protein [Actinomycetales bacterium]